MELDAGQAAGAAKDLLVEADREWSRLKQFSEYERGVQAMPYTPKQLTHEFRELAQRSLTNLLPNVLNTLVDRLYVDGFRPDVVDMDDGDVSAVESAGWSWWQANGMDARQQQLYHLTARHGYAYMMVWPGDNGTPWLRPKSPRQWFAQFDVADDDFPELAVRRRNGRVEILDDRRLWVLSKQSTSDRYDVEGAVEHGAGVVPLVRYMNAWPDEGEHPVGEIEKLIHVQDRLNQTVFDLLVTQTYMGAPQQWVAGIVADADDKVKAMAKRVWTFDEPATQVGQLPQADLGQLIKAIDNSIRMYGIKAQMPPNYLLGEMVNISADALVAAHADLDAKVESRQALHAESHERMFRLGGRIAGVDAIGDDDQAQVVWRRTDPRSLASTVDALGKMVSMLHVPPDEVWTMVPGVTQQDVARWRRRQDELDPLQLLDREVSRLERVSADE